MTDPGQTSSAGPAPRPTTRPGRLRRALRRWQLPLAAVLPCLLLAGVGWWFWPNRPLPVPLHLVSGTVQADLLSPDEASRVTGVSLTEGPRAAHPAPALTSDPSSCGVAVGPTGQAVYGSAWNAFLTAVYQEAGGFGDYTLNQTVGVYPTGDKASTVLRTLTTGLRSCPSATRATAKGGRSSKWVYHVDSATPNGVVWTATQDGGNGWACYRAARTKGRSLFQVGICGEGGQGPPVQNLLQLVAAKVSG